MLIHMGMTNKETSYFLAPTFQFHDLERKFLSPRYPSSDSITNITIGVALKGKDQFRTKNLWSLNSGEDGHFYNRLRTLKRLEILQSLDVVLI